MPTFYEPPPADEAVSSTHEAFAVPDSDEEDEAADDKAAGVASSIAEALQRLSLEDREQVYMEQHGVSDSMDYDDKSEFVTQKLIELGENLQILVSNKDVPTSAYQIACEQNIDYVQDTTFRLRFLYAELFDTRKAASRMIRYFNYKQHLFGDTKLTKHLGFSDLSSEELGQLKEGAVQRLPRRDTAGRAVFIMFPKQTKKYGSDNLGRIFSVMEFFGYSWIEKKGIVLISYHLCDSTEYEKGDRRSTYMGSRAISDLPVRFAAIHQCSDDPLFHSRVHLFTQLSSTHTRAKSKIHIGTHAECMRSLMAFGIPHNLVPFGANGTIKRKSHMEWFRKREVLEACIQSGSSVQIVELPGNYDVLLGRGTNIQEHLGNKYLLNLVDTLLPQYDSIQSRAEKKAFSIEVIRKIQSLKGRFLTQESGIWTEVSDDIAREKVSHLFRNRRSKAKPKHVVVTSSKVSGSLDGSDYLHGSPTGEKRARVGE